MISYLYYDEETRRTLFYLYVSVLDPMFDQDPPIPSSCSCSYQQIESSFESSYADERACG
jgi:hypothetical protein